MVRITSTLILLLMVVSIVWAGPNWGKTHPALIDSTNKPIGTAAVFDDYNRGCLDKPIDVTAVNDDYLRYSMDVPIYDNPVCDDYNRYLFTKPFDWYFKYFRTSPKSNIGSTVSAPTNE